MDKMEAVAKAADGNKQMTLKWCAVNQAKCREHCVHFRKARAYRFDGRNWHVDGPKCRLWG